MIKWLFWINMIAALLCLITAAAGLILDGGLAWTLGLLGLSFFNALAVKANRDGVLDKKRERRLRHEH